MEINPWVAAGSRPWLLQWMRFLDAESIRRVRPNVGSDASFVAKRQPITARNRDPIFLTGLEKAKCSTF